MSEAGGKGSERTGGRSMLYCSTCGVYDGCGWARVRTSIPMPVGPEAPVTQTTLPFRLKSSRRDSAFGTPIGMIEVDKRQRGVEWDELIVKGITELLC